MAREDGRDGLVHVGCLPSDATAAIIRPATTTPAAIDIAAPTRFVLLSSIPCSAHSLAVQCVGKSSAESIAIFFIYV